MTRDELFFTQKSVYETADDAKIREIYDFAEGYMVWLDKSRTERLAVRPDGNDVPSVAPHEVRHLDLVRVEGTREVAGRRAVHPHVRAELDAFEPQEETSAAWPCPRHGERPPVESRLPRDVVIVARLAEAPHLP